MPITVSCQCGAKFAAKDELAGKAVKCPKCSQPIKIPGGTAPAATPQKTAPKTPATSTPGTQQKAATTPARPATKTPATTPTPAPSAIGSILDEIGLQGSKTGQQCPKCRADMAQGAIICVACGFNTASGKQLVTKADADAKRRREEIERRQREKAEAAFQAGGGYSGSGGSSSKYSEVDSTLPIMREGPSAGAAMRTTWKLLFEPATAYGDLPTRGGVGHAVTYALTCAATVIGFYLIIVFVLQLASFAFALTDPRTQEVLSKNPERLAYALGMVVGADLAIFVIGMCFVALVLFVQGPLFSLGAHLVLKYAGGSTLGFGSTFQCVLYGFGITYMLGGIPIVNFIASIVGIVYMGIGFAHHHRVNGGIATLAVIVGMIIVIAVFVVLYLLGALAILGMLMALQPKRGF